MTYHFQLNEWGDRYIDELNPSVFTRTRARDYFDVKMGVDFSDNDTLHIVIGSDSGLYAKHVQTLEIGKGSRIVFVEPDDVYAFLRAELGDLPESAKETPADSTTITHAGSDTDPSADPNSEPASASASNSNTDSVTSYANEDGVPIISCVDQSQWNKQLVDGLYRFWFVGGNVKLLQSSACESDYTQIYFPLYRHVLSEMENYSVNIQRMMGVKSFVEMQICNAADNVTPFIIDTDFGKGYTAVVLGGSPSLDDHIAWIMENRDRLFIIAVSRICKKLVELDLKPDLLVAIDPHPFSYDVSKQGLLWDDVPMINNYHLAPQMLQEWRGCKFYMGPRLPWTEVISNQPVAGGPTVGHTGLIVASHLGFSSIALAGIDLCYAPDGVTHAASSPEAIFHQLPCLYDAKVQTYTGQTAGTSLEFLNSIEALNTIGATINKNEPIVFNLCANAARVDSIDHIDRHRIVLPESKPDFSTQLSRLNRIDRQDDLKDLKKTVSEARAQFQSIIRSCKQALILVNKMYAPGASKPATVYSRRLDKIEARMESSSAIYLRSIRHYLLTDFSELKKPRQFVDLKESERETWIRQYYQLTRKGARKFDHMLADLEQRIQIRCMEKDSSTTCKKLLEHWARDKTPGRVMLNSDILNNSSSPADCASVAASREAFIESINNSNTGHAQSLKEVHTDIGACIRTLTFLSSNGDTNDLDLLSARLSPSVWPSNVLKLFCDGLRADLQKQPAVALTNYQSIIDVCSDKLSEGEDDVSALHRLIEESLSRMTRLFLDNGDTHSACTTLGTLCELRPNYILSYAKLLNLSGNHEFAIELLEIFLENFTGNWRAAVLLADIHEELGQHELSRIASDRAAAIRHRLSDTTDLSVSSGVSQKHAA